MIHLGLSDGHDLSEYLRNPTLGPFDTIVPLSPRITRMSV